MSNTLPEDVEKGITQQDYSSADYEAPHGVNSKDTAYPENPVLRVTTSSNGDVVYLGEHAYNRKELINAFAGDLNPGLHKAPYRPMGNPVPLGLSSFSICCFVVSLVNCGARDVHNVNVIAACALFFGGIIESITGLWCLVIENTFAATALGSFGGFWMGYAGILIDAFGIASSYDTTEELNNAIGFYLTAWVIFAFLMWLCTFKATWPFFILFLLLWVFIMCLAIGSFTNLESATKAGGVLGLLATFVAFYIVYAGVATDTNSYITIPATPMPHAPTV
ncbi:CYFA0S14e03092g1_1 [Cyberlindnera fabianii]|uniref:Ammonia transport outward protein 2 n=1 Tax=Cyberlindnera fabianii TaxID=36022 RepID=A0A061BC21_CYBFA|nr:Ammonia transport outward protein 2 [Cyberlindnera fabianii]CDR44475.1 CYFA0S14e03092g1_1 [Cyberlindnera fabianii]